MKDDTRTKRQKQIELAAYRVLEDKGFAGASMLAIAKQAKASNETLFSALVARNAADRKSMLEEHLRTKTTPSQILARIAPALLGVLVSDQAIALNRAAAADSSGILGQAIMKSGRNTIAPLIAETLERAKDEGELMFETTNDAVSLFLDLLVGDLQIRRAIGQVAAPSLVEIERRASQTLARFHILLAP